MLKKIPFSQTLEMNKLHGASALARRDKWVVEVFIVFQANLASFAALFIIITNVALQSSYHIFIARLCSSKKHGFIEDSLLQKRNLRRDYTLQCILIILGKTHIFMNRSCINRCKLGYVYSMTNGLTDPLQTDWVQMLSEIWIGTVLI